MKCNHCGIENRKNAKFCASCGKPLNVNPESTKDNSKLIIILLIVIVLILVGTIGFFTLNNYSNGESNDIPLNTSSSQEVGQVDSKNSSTNGAKTQENVSIITESKSWEPIGSYSGSGSGSKSISVPEGKIKIELSAYPIKNYASNYLKVYGSNGESGGVEWGSHSSVETRSDSFSYTSSSSETFTIDFYETVSWEVNFYRYQ